jgi:replication fork clamp-binding protein CrfC
MILMHHIRNTLPDIKNRIQTQLTKYQNELSQLGGAEGDQNSGNIILNIITEFSQDFRTAIEGKNTDLNLNELSGGARISFVFHELYSNGVKSMDPYDQVKDADIRTILYNSSVSSCSSGLMLLKIEAEPLFVFKGSSPALFVGTAAFETIVKQQIKRLEDPSLRCASLVYDELVRILNQLLVRNVSNSFYGFSKYCCMKLTD